MNCIACSNPMTQRHHEGVTIDECPAGHGMWLDRGELKQVTDSTLAARSTEEQQAALDAARSRGVGALGDALTEQSRPCPRCGRDMQKLTYAEYSGIVMDSCAEHGVWLDAGELERIEAYAEATAGGATWSGDGSRSLPPHFLSGLSQFLATPPS